MPVVTCALCVLVDGSGFSGAWAAGLAFGIRLRTASPDRSSVTDDGTQLPGMALLGDVVAGTVGLSVVPHGATALFLGNRYGDWFAAARQREPQLREDAPARPTAPQV